MRNITAAAFVLGLCKLGFSTAMLALGAFRLGLGAGEVQTLAFVTLVFGNQAVLYVVRERRHLWSSKPGVWVLAASAGDIAIVSALALSGILMEPLAWRIVAAIFAAAIGFAFILDQIKLRITAKIGIE
jgi:H+-transporting ATPase